MAVEASYTRRGRTWRAFSTGHRRIERSSTFVGATASGSPSWLRTSWRACWRPLISCAHLGMRSACSLRYVGPSASGEGRIREIASSTSRPSSRGLSCRKPGRREAVFQREFVEDLRHWVATDRRVSLRALDLVEAILRDPFTGIGKPEPLKYLAAGTWSRRLTQEHRMVYLVRATRIDFLQARYHY